MALLIPWPGGLWRWLLTAFGAAGYAAFFVPVAPAQNAPGEYQVKAAFLFNFVQFVDWPASAFFDPQAPMVIGVLGDDPFGPYLDEIVRGETFHGRPLVVRRYARAEEIADCHVLFISRTESGRLERILGALKSRSILTVSDMDNFVPRGGMIRLFTERGKIRMRINVDAPVLAGLTISSKLLRSAETVGRGGRD